MNFYENILLSKCWRTQGLVQSKVDGPEIQKWVVFRHESGEKMQLSGHGVQN